MSRSDRIKGYVGCGLLFMLLVGSFGGTDTQQAIAFCFGATYGALWINHD